MLTNHGLRVTTVAAITLALALPGCMEEVETTEDAEVSAIAAALEQENGGLTMDDEAPAFGQQDLMNEATLPQEDFADPYLEDLEIQQMQQAPDAVVFHTLVMWGQFPLNLELQQPRNWSGALHVNRGAIIVNKTVAFEGPTDNMLPRPDPQTVTFSSATLPHHDGLRLTIIDPDPLNSEPMTLTYATPNGPLISLPMAALVNGPVNHVVDEDDNRVVAVAQAQPVDVCAHGTLGGNWHQLVPGRGKFIGPVVNALGDPIGHVRGIYGVRNNGKEVFFGKYINTNGKFMGIFAGRYGDEQFEGRWLHRSGEVGALGGGYRETIPGPETGGHFLGRWTETSCNVRLP
jgi:hypothetical protein